LKEDVRPYLAALDIFMLTSEFEGLPVALLEAMAMEKAIVSTRAGGIPEVVENDVTGLLVPVDRPMDCIQRVVTLLDNYVSIAALGKAARRKIVENFSIENMVQKLEAVYDNVQTRY
jgi:glycosyltransferase involved in cell wall biosynthesis